MLVRSTTHSDFLTINSEANGFAVKDHAGVNNRLVVVKNKVLLGVPIQLAKYQTASLPTCNSAAEGTLAAVGDASSATFNPGVAGGGGDHVMAYCNGTRWTVH